MQRKEQRLCASGCQNNSLICLLIDQPIQTLSNYDHTDFGHDNNCGLHTFLYSVSKDSEKVSFQPLVEGVGISRIINYFPPYLQMHYTFSICNITKTSSLVGRKVLDFLAMSPRVNFVETKQSRQTISRKYQHKNKTIINSQKHR